MSLSVFDLFSIGVGPSSSHTVGPMRAAAFFARELRSTDLLARTARVRAELFGSLAATGVGHRTPEAVLLGLCGNLPHTVDPDAAQADVRAVEESGRLVLLGAKEIPFAPATDLVMKPDETLPRHANAMRLTAYAADGTPLLAKTYYSVGGGFIVDEDEACADPDRAPRPDVPYPFRTAQELLATTRRTGLRISSLVLANELSRRSHAEVHQRLGEIWQVMDRCIERGLAQEGVLPGGLGVRRRAAITVRQLTALGVDHARSTEWATAYAMAVSEENAAGGRVVTAPTNGAAGVIPAVLRHYLAFASPHLSPSQLEAYIGRFLLAAGAFGLLLKENASLSGAEVGCQGEIGSACAMAAAGLTEALGGTPEQVENAAEIGMEHNLGLTCDPVAGLVQIPCIERNGMAAVKAIAAARMALRGDGHHRVGFDEVTLTMKETGVDMLDKYRETARGGLAVNVTVC
ncbi:L-serine ammonia-lyase [Streptomyces sp. NPDC004111]|uniref:L-serine ammonia-lyase n=1 Tax=Streptomyces sp. NPDC004111 TaxID=3364690 RepID=UPI003676FFFB